MNKHCQTKLVPQKISSSEHIIEIVIFHCMNQNWVTLTFTLKAETCFFIWHSGLYWCLTILDSVTNGSAMHKISSKLTLTDTFNLGCDIDLEHCNQIFSLDTSLLMMIYTHWVWMQKTHWFRINKTYNRNCDISMILAHTVTLTLKIEPHLFRMTVRLMVVHHNTKFGYKRLHTKTQPSGNKYVSPALHPSPPKTPQCFPFCSKIIHHTQRKSADVDWYARVGRKSMVQAEIIMLCARTLHHCESPRQPLLKKWL